jgi:hypothetical protein
MQWAFPWVKYGSLLETSKNVSSNVECKLLAENIVPLIQCTTGPNDFLDGFIAGYLGKI